MQFSQSIDGFFDGHCHPLFAGREIHGAILHECETFQDLVQAISIYRLDNPTKTWFDLSAIKASAELAALLNRDSLDEIVEDVPLVIHTEDHHSIVVNSKALEISGFAESAPAVAGGHFQLDGQSRPTGWIHEYSAMSLIYAHQPKPSLEEDLAALVAAQHELLANSVSGVLDAWIDPGMPEIYIAAVHAGLLHLQVNLACRIKPEAWRTDLDFAIDTRTKVWATASELLTAKTVKIFADGVHSSNTAHLLRDESTASLWDFEEMVKMALEADLAGFQLHIHACGDGAVRTAINVISQVIQKNPKWDRRPVIAHAEEIHPSDIARLNQFDISVNLQPAWLNLENPDWHPIRALLDAEVKVGFGSDWPVSKPTAQRALDHLQSLGAQNPNWAISAADAVAAYSQVAAWQNYFER